MSLRARAIHRQMPGRRAVLEAARLPRQSPTFILLCAAACAPLSACESTRGSISRQTSLLAASGFDVKPADSPERQNELSSLPPNRFVMRAKGDHVVYLYADPVVCDCLYVGDQMAYNTYKRFEFERHIADQQQLTAQMYQSRWDWSRWRWGPWGWDARFSWW